jgi:hypothetical protein
VKAEYNAADFERSIKNPYFEKLNQKSEVSIRREIYKIFREIGEQNGVEPEVIMSRCLADYAKRLHDDE